MRSKIALRGVVSKNTAMRPKMSTGGTQSRKSTEMRQIKEYCGKTALKSKLREMQKEESFAVLTSILSKFKRHRMGKHFKFILSVYGLMLH